MEIDQHHLKSLRAQLWQASRSFDSWGPELCEVTTKSLTLHYTTLQAGHVFGLQAVCLLSKQWGDGVSVATEWQDGDEVMRGSVLLSITGPAGELLRLEQVFGEFLARMCGITSLAVRYVRFFEDCPTSLIEGTSCDFGLGIWERGALRQGGVEQQKSFLKKAVYIRKSLSRAVGSVAQAVNYFTEALPPVIRLKVQATDLQDVRQAVQAGAHIIAVSGMASNEIRMAARITRDRAFLEVDMRLSEAICHDLKQCGVDFVNARSLLDLAVPLPLRIQSEIHA